MSLKKQIDDKLNQALKAKDKNTYPTLRLIVSAIKLIWTFSLWLILNIYHKDLSIWFLSSFDEKIEKSLCSISFSSSFLSLYSFSSFLLVLSFFITNWISLSDIKLM